MTVFVIIFAIY